ncbi:MAG TPA: L,D-transpeptidase family protein, partial [Vicinamibacterales bacterium]|nr:L,D-transpeptidase family protein [Vicinamibacterales bacterium]
VGGTRLYVVTSGETLTSIAAKHGVTVASIGERNGLTPSGRLAVGTTLVIDNPHIAIVDPRASIAINIAQRMLFLATGSEVLGYPVTVGSRGWPTPLGDFTIKLMETDPTWDVPISIQREMEAQGQPVVTSVPPSPDNPLGTRWLALSIPGLGIHGTNAPSSIYRYASHGCIRMHPEHIVELFDRVAVGMLGVLTYEPIVMAVVDGRVWLEVHPDPYRRVSNPLTRARAIAASLAAMEFVDWPALEAALGRRDGRAEDVTRRLPSR